MPESRIQPSASCPGFTLVELLVVITVIVVLLSLLAPGLDQAIYQAELAACGASLDATATGITTYAMNHKRAYPDRPADWYAPTMFANGNVPDQRQRLAPYVGINGAFNDPLSRAVDYTDTTPPGTTMPWQGGWAARFFWYRKLWPNDRAMNKLGDFWTWTDEKSAQNMGRVYHFNALVTDIDMVADNNQVWGSHPDDRGHMINSTYQNQVPPEHERAPGMGTNAFIMSRWWRGTGAGLHDRGLVDLNFAATDGAVTRFPKVAWTELVLGAETTELRGVPWTSEETYAGQIRCAVPKIN